MNAHETEKVRARYARRSGDAERYSLLNPPQLLIIQERQRAMARLLVRLGFFSLAQLRLVEVGCGTGANLVELLRLGFRPEHLQGVEVLEGALERARDMLPPSVRLIASDAARIDLFPPASQDIVFQSTVFSSILDDAFQERLAGAMWHWVRPGGGVLWYDFVVNNPRNRDVRGVPVARIRRLFPRGDVSYERLTLAPPLARAATRVHPSLYHALNAFPFLRTHVLAWVGKPDETGAAGF